MSFILPAKILSFIGRQCTGAVKTVRGPFIRGSVKSTAKNPPAINLVLDGKVVSTCYPHNFQPGITCNFSLVAPASLFDGTNKLASVCFANGKMLKNGKVRIKGNRAGEGYIDCVDDQGIAGWAWSWRDPEKAVTLEVLIDGKPKELVIADFYRQDVASKVGTSGFNGFQYGWPLGFSIASINRLNFRIQGTDELLKWRIGNDALDAPSKGSKAQKPWGNVEKIEPMSCTGWALDPDTPEQPVVVDVLVDGVVINSVLADTFRKDLSEELGTHGRHGFRCNLPYGLRVENINSVVCRIRKNGNILPRRRDMAEWVGNYKSHGRVGLGQKFYRPAFPKLYQPALAVKGSSTLPEMNKRPSLELIILNRNGGGHLERLFSSLFAYNTYDNLKITIVDHGSQDNSADICRVWQEKLPVNFVPRGGNYSFSESNNYAAEKSDADILFFLNNDIIFCKDILPALIRHIVDGAADLVGPKLNTPPIALFPEGATVTECAQFSQHLGLQFSWRTQGRPFHVYDLPVNNDSMPVVNSAWQTPGVTGAALMIRRDAFVLCGGFNENYFYGYEDVDFNLCAYAINKLKIVCDNSQVAWHFRGATRSLDVTSGKKGDPNLKVGEKNNFSFFMQRFCYLLKGKRREEWLSDNRIYNIQKPVIAFIVEKADLWSGSEEFFPAYELAEAMLGNLDARIVYVEKENWHNLDDVDVVIVMRPDFNPGEIRNASACMRLVAWAVNNVDEWLESEWLGKYDEIWSAAGNALDRFREKAGCEVRFLPMATNRKRFVKGHYSAKYHCDYAYLADFGADAAGVKKFLPPDKMPYEFAIYGKDWQNDPDWKDFNRGPVDYEQLPLVYASSNIVIDYVNPAESSCGLVHAAVYDAIAAGALVITNSKTASREIFAGLLPCYEDQDGLTRIIDFYMKNEKERDILIRKLKRMVLGANTYAFRALQIKDYLSSVGRKLRFAIKIDTNNEDAISLVRQLGHSIMKIGELSRIIDVGENYKLERCLAPGDDVRIDIGMSDGEAETGKVTCCVMLEDMQNGERKNTGKYDYILYSIGDEYKLMTNNNYKNEILGDSDEEQLNILLKKLANECLERQSGIKNIINE